MVHQRPQVTPAPAPRLHHEGDRGRAVCERCGAVVPTTFRRRDVPFSDGAGVAPNLLVSVCNRCDEVVGVPAQSIPAIREARKATGRPIEAQLPAIYVDALDLAAHAISSTASTDFRRLLVTWFLHRAASDPRGGAKLRAAHDRAETRFPEQRGAPRRRLSMKVSPEIDAEFRALAEATDLSATAVLKSLVFEIHAAVVEAPSPTLIKTLRDLAAIAG